MYVMLYDITYSGQEIRTDVRYAVRYNIVVKRLEQM